MFCLAPSIKHIPPLTELTFAQKSALIRRPSHFPFHPTQPASRQPTAPLFRFPFLSALSALDLEQCPYLARGQNICSVFRSNIVFGSRLYISPNGLNLACRQFCQGNWPIFFAHLKDFLLVLIKIVQKPYFWTICCRVVCPIGQSLPEKCEYLQLF